MLDCLYCCFLNTSLINCMFSTRCCLTDQQIKKVSNAVIETVFITALGRFSLFFFNACIYLSKHKYNKTYIVPDKTAQHKKYEQ